MKAVKQFIGPQLRFLVCRIVIAGLMPAVPLCAKATDVPDLLNEVTANSQTMNSAYTPLPLIVTNEWTETEVVLSPPTSAAALVAPTLLSQDVTSDRIWLISTRHLTCDVCRINLHVPDFRIARLDRCGRSTASSLQEYESTFQADRPRLIYIHGNRRTAEQAVDRGLDMYREITKCGMQSRPIDWVIWSWQSDQVGLALRDARIKAERTNSQSLYLAWLLTHHVQAQQPTSLIGFSFGGRIVTGGLHVLAGGKLKGRTLDTPPIRDAGIDVGLIAPAVQSNWLLPHGNHGLATQNMDQMVLLYNPNDGILKNYWLVDQIRGATALGYSGPRGLAPRADGSRVPVRQKNCGQTVGNHHKEAEYFQPKCYAGREMATLVESSLIRQ